MPALSRAARIVAAPAALALVAGLLSGALAATPATAADSGCPVAAGSFAGGDGSAGAPYEVSNAAELQLLKDDSSFWASDFVVTADISLAGCTWDRGIGTPTTPFTGSLDGADYTVSDLTVTASGDFAADPDGGAAGLFGVAGAGAAVTNLRVLGTISATIENASAVAGGIAGRTVGATFTDVHFTGRITASATGAHPSVGGIVGHSTNTTIERASSTTVMSSGPTGRADAGGITGWFAFDLGQAGSALIADSWATGRITADGDAQSSAGGLVGYATAFTEIQRSFADAQVTAGAADEPAAGGILGWGAAVLENTYALGSVTSGKVAGGLIGMANQRPATRGLAIDSYFSGRLSDTTWTPKGTGGIAGAAAVDSGITTFASTDVFWDTTVSSEASAVSGVYNPWVQGAPLTAPGAQGKTTAELNDLATFINWDITDGYSPTSAWSMCAGHNGGYPFLSALVDADPCSGVPAVTISPSNQTIPGEIGDVISTTPFTTTGFVNTPIYTVTPALPTGLSLDPFTGQITGTVQGLDDQKTYTITASASAPSQSATATVTQTGSLRLPGQVTTRANAGADASYSAVAVRPSDGYSLVIALGTVPDQSGASAIRVLTYLMDPLGNRSGAEHQISASNHRINRPQQPSVQFNPRTGGWLACYTRFTALIGSSTETLCQYLNPDGSAVGPAFAADTVATDNLNQTALVYSDRHDRFLLIATRYSVGPVGRFIDSAGSGVVGDLFVISAGLTTTLEQEGGMDLAYSEESDRYLLMTRGSDNGQSPSPWVYHLGTDGRPTGEPSRLYADTTMEVINGSVAWNSATNTFMVVSFLLDYDGSLIAQPYAAQSGTAVGSPVVTPISNYGGRWRPYIASHPRTSTFVVATTLSYREGQVAYKAAVTIALDATGVPQTPEILAGTAANATKERVQVVFDPYACAFTVGYSWTAPGWGLQRFITPVQASDPCVATAPLGVTATAGDASASLSWQAPLDVVGGPLTGYVVRVRQGSNVWRETLTNSTGTQFVLTQLVNGTAAEIQVAARSDGGTGFWSESVFVTPASVGSITITGQRGTGRTAGLITVAGTSAGMVGKKVLIRLRLAGQPRYATVARVAVRPDGRFTWSFSTWSTAYVVAVRPGTRSNRLVIAGR